MPGHPSSPPDAVGLRMLRPFACAAAMLVLSGCSLLPSIRDADSFLGLITPYRMDIVQGNVLTKEQAEQVKPGMSRNQVRELLGSPMLTDMFHSDRWDYTFTIRRQGTAPQRRNVVVHFENDRLTRIEAPDLPTEQEFVASISRNATRGAKAPVLELTEAQRKALPAPSKAEAAPAAAPVGAVRTYPPLEPS